jgi:hypothetical protein
LILYVLGGLIELRCQNGHGDRPVEFRGDLIVDQGWVIRVDLGKALSLAACDRSRSIPFEAMCELLMARTT